MDSKMRELLKLFQEEIGGKSLVYYYQPGVEVENHGLRMIYQSLKNGKTCVFVASSTAPSVIRNQFRESGLDIDPYMNRLIFVDAYNPLIMAPSREKYVISNPDNINEISKTVIGLMKELQPSTILFGSLSTIMDLCGEEATIEAIRIWNETANNYYHDIIYNFTAWPYSRQTLDEIKNGLFNSVISISGISGNILKEHTSLLLNSACN